MQLGEVLSGVDRSQKEIEIVTGLGGGDCGYEFQTGVDYVVYAYKNAEGRLEANICSRTRPLPETAEDMEYFRAMSDAPEIGEIRVRTSPWDAPGKPGVTIVAAGAGSRHSVLTDDTGAAVFTGMSPGEYTIHAESDGDLPDDPKVELHAKGCLDLTLFRTLRITGRVTTTSGLAGARVEIQLRSTQDTAVDETMTDSDGRYELRIVRAGQYYLGINLNRTATPDSSYPRWFYPGTDDPALATRIEFDGKPEVRTYDFTLPDTQSGNASF
jgi:carboxypeptidase family protein